MAETNVAITAGAGTPIDAFNSGAGSALRQAVVLADSVTTANVAKVNSDGGLLVAGTQPSGTSVAWTSATAVNTALTQTVTGYNTVSYAVTTTTTLTGGAITFEVFEPLTNAWYPLQAARINTFNTESVYTLIANNNQAWSTSVDGFTQTRIRLSTAIVGTATVTVSISPQTFAIEPIVTVGQATASSLNVTLGAGANVIGGITNIIPGTGNTNAGAATGAAISATKVGGVALYARQDTLAALTPASGQYTEAKTDSQGAVWTHATGGATGGSTTFTLISAATTNATSVKASSGTLYMLSATNNSATVAFLKLYNLATAPTVGTSTPVLTFMLPANGGISVAIPPQGLNFSAGISYALTGLATLADTTAVAAAQVQVNGSYV